VLEVDKKLAIGSRETKITTTGIKLPKNEIRNTFQKGRFSMIRPIGIETFNSDKGAIAKIKI